MAVGAKPRWKRSRCFHRGGYPEIRKPFAELQWVPTTCQLLLCSCPSQAGWMSWSLSVLPTCQAGSIIYSKGNCLIFHVSIAEGTAGAKATASLQQDQHSTSPRPLWSFKMICALLPVLRLCKSTPYLCLDDFCSSFKTECVPCSKKLSSVIHFGQSSPACGYKLVLITVLSNIWFPHTTISMM